MPSSWTPTGTPLVSADHADRRQRRPRHRRRHPDQAGLAARHHPDPRRRHRCCRSHLQPRLPRVRDQDTRRPPDRRPAEPPEVEGLRQAVRQRRPTPTAGPARSPRSTNGCAQNRVVYVAVLGDFNDTPDSEPLAPLLDRHRPARHRHPPDVQRRRPARAPSATAPPRRRSTTSCCPRPCTRRSPVAASTGSAPGAARTAPCGRTTTPSPRRSMRHRTTARSMPTSG